MSKWQNLIPAPLAAPETREMKAARIRVLLGCVATAALIFFFAELRSACGFLALPMLASASVFTAVQGVFWLRTKNAADDAWLFRESDDAA